MNWGYWDWVGCSVGISTGIVVLTLAVLIILLIENDTIFYGIVAQLLSMERCFIDVHHNLIRKDEKLDLSLEKILKSLPPEVGIAMLSANHGDTKDLVTAWQNLVTERSKSENSEEDPDNTSQRKKDSGEVNHKSASHNIQGKKQERERPLHDKSRSDLERPVLNMYGRYISLHKKQTPIFLIIMTTIIISAALIAAFNSLFLNTSTVYPNGPCPSLGPMQCFCGRNQTFFSCDTGKMSSCPLSETSGACFRWIARDMTTSDLTTQLGVTTGLLVAFGNIAQAVIRIYLLAFNKRLSIATGIHRIAAKTIGINRHTARTSCCCCRLPWHCSACNLRLFKHPAAVIISTAFYIMIPFLMIPAVILLYYFELSVTALTFVVLIVVAIICILAMVWILVQESEASSNIPGGWADAKQLLQSVGLNAKKVAHGGG